MPAGTPLLEIEGLKIGFDTEAGFVQAVDGVSLSVAKGRTLGVVGESGCGKSVTAAAVLRLIPNPPGRIHGGEVRFRGTNVLRMTPEALTELRGQEVAMIFQDPMTSLNPVFTVERQMGEVLRIRFGMKREAARSRLVEMLQKVGISDPESRLSSYPHELSGGMKQRVMIAMALLGAPSLLIADEPTTALDVTVQAQILQLIRELQRETGAAVLFITHDMGVIAQMCDEVAVMYAGRVVETGAVTDIFERSRHPYTRGLLRSVPRRGVGRKGALPTIEGVVPSLLNPPVGCRFAGRCWRKRELSEADQLRCVTEDPALRGNGGTLAACHFPVDGGEG